MIIISQIPESIKKSFDNYQDIFFKDNEFDSVSRYLTGLVCSPNKTLQAIHELQIWPNDKSVSRKTMHNRIFNGRWNHEELMSEHRKVVSKDHQGNHGKEVIALDWTLGHHHRGPEIFGVTWQYDPNLKRNCFCQTIITAAISNSKLIDGIAIEVQKPSLKKRKKNI